MVALKIGALISLLLIVDISCLVSKRRNDRFLKSFAQLEKEENLENAIDSHREMRFFDELGRVFQLFRVRQYHGDEITKKEMENETHRDVFRRWRRWGTNVESRDDTIAVAGKLTPVKAADALLRSRSRLVRHRLKSVHVRKACTVTCFSVTSARCHKAPLTFDRSGKHITLRLPPSSERFCGYFG
ncbi:hypothetical protein DMN91_001137 [Ooceraea biroi]|uniref:Uncharacterized protein n=1 Tax=Ooceraea biroi TaxID=2015173 RepID=A0A3L8E3Y4_OOCBI|nr:hypothetical protein DMN91_001137 [Ooceraea biroi]